ncbi:MAG: VacJ family lipoprotein [Proteobacteria bacterium]|nr:VacJ family lipoprotein [Pseudomonadota bacterium]MBU1688926.1 VacJ family lipoprotein [Pseudomonadota bacterium]
MPKVMDLFSRHPWKSPLVAGMCFVFLGLLSPWTGHTAPGAGIGSDGSGIGYPLVEDSFFEEEDAWQEEETAVLVADPLETWNRLVFSFNDLFYSWVMRPVASGYAGVIPEPARECVSNFFHNLRTPIRLANGLLQGKIVRSGNELSRFVVNSTLGVAGLWDPAYHWLHLSGLDEDVGQTLGKYGMGEGIYLCLPFFGPSNLRDSLGLVGNYFLDPVSLLAIKYDEKIYYSVRSGEELNKASFRLDEYESFKAATFDPYSALRDASIMYRRQKVNDEDYTD